jgi:hypothetical protein
MDIMRENAANGILSQVRQHAFDKTETVEGLYVSFGQ